MHLLSTAATIRAWNETQREQRASTTLPTMCSKEKRTFLSSCFSACKLNRIHVLEIQFNKNKRRAVSQEEGGESSRQMLVTSLMLFLQELKMIPIMPSLLK